MNIQLRTLRPSDAAAMQLLFCAAINAIDQSLYSSAEKQAWIGPQPKGWCTLLTAEKGLGLFCGTQLLGFIIYQPQGYLNCLYIDPAYQGQGIASELHRAFLSAVKANKVEQVWVEASLAAEPVFRHWGYKAIKRQHIERAGEFLTNSVMVKAPV
ncbi:GNAT family N-acetyltransferase [Neptunomonas marina]|nr:GNAT family N-acetyltransferase [Neptunomonas marina]